MKSPKTAHTLPGWWQKKLSKLASYPKNTRGTVPTLLTPNVAITTVCESLAAEVKR